ncbi:MAG: hypothetical protein M3Z37_08410 [Candidatus Eremiobacteraeota bacterium]|nr:hypothetical protein [Candidatus Eremiobacteraeota bacterium]
MTDSVFLAKLIDFVIFLAVIIWLYNRFGKTALIAHQEAQNKAVADALSRREAAEASVGAAQAAIDQAKRDAQRMVEVASAQAARLIQEERAAAKAHAERILAHAAGDLERERYRVRREMLEQTVESAHAQARELAQRELDPAKQAALVDRALGALEKIHG